MGMVKAAAALAIAALFLIIHLANPAFLPHLAGLLARGDIQETALYADKVNYTEETVRLGSHFAQFSSILASADGPVGRKLDFLIQEMNREANTIGSKCNSAKAAQLVVDLKSEIEKLREQVQNIE